VDSAALEAPRRPRWKVVATVALLLILVEIALSLAWPHRVPRFAWLPKPPERSWNDGCNDHSRTYERGGIAWTAVEASTLVGCIAP
jgi:hypothetical protein